jgi:hypothetical protein
MGEFKGKKWSWEADVRLVCVLVFTICVACFATIRRMSLLPAISVIGSIEVFVFTFSKGGRERLLSSHKAFMEYLDQRRR